MIPMKLLALLLAFSLIFPIAGACPVEYLGHSVKITVVTEDCPSFGDLDYFTRSCEYNVPVRNATVTFKHTVNSDGAFWWACMIYGACIREDPTSAPISGITDENGDEVILSVKPYEKYNVEVTNTSRRDSTFLIIPSESTYVVWVKP